MSGLQPFQRELAAHLRDPAHVRRPPGVPARAAVVYAGLLRNNLRGFVDACFPVARATLGERRWTALVGRYFRRHASHTPYFSRIAGEFAAWAAGAGNAPGMPPWLPELLHYEWIELAVDTDPAVVGSRAEKCLQLNPTLRNLAYAWPVHRIGPAYRPRKPQAAHLLVYRDADDAVRFMEINALTARLLDIIASGPIGPGDAIAVLARDLGHPDADALQAHGRNLLAELIRQQALTGDMP